MDTFTKVVIQVVQKLIMLKLPLFDHLTKKQIYPGTI
jgi:hypothetical protein